METDDVRPTLPALDERDVAAVEAILARTVRAQERRARDREEVKAANIRIEEATKVVAGAYEALKVFGFVEATEDANLWNLVREALGGQRYNQVIADARREAVQDPAPKAGSGQADSGIHGITENGSTTAHMEGSVPIRTAILEYLVSRGPQGAKVAEVKKYLVDAHGLTVHEKTPGMTLYRLLKDGLVSRTGRTWFVVAKSETDDSGAEDFNELFDEVEGDQSEEAYQE